MKLRINGQEVTISAAGDTPLLWVLRDELGLQGTKFGCGVAMCGACTVHVDGFPMRSCSMSVEDAVGTDITTIEAVSTPVAQAVTAAWSRLDVVQCGYCQSGQVMSAIALLNETPNPTDDDIDAAMSGNICRCNTYKRIRAAIHEAARSMEA